MSGKQLTRRQCLQAASGLAAGMAAPIALARVSEPPGPAPGSQSPEGGGAPRIGLALGAGGANGLAHISVLQVFEDLGLTPHHIAGSSIGAVIGAMYCSGLAAEEIRAMVGKTFADDDAPLLPKLLSQEALHWVELLEIDLGSGGLLNSHNILAGIYAAMESHSFEHLRVPLSVVAANIWTNEQIVLDSGPIMPAVQASMALPGVFNPVIVEDQVLVDGGTVNPVPWDLLLDSCDVVVGIDVSGVRTRGEDSGSGPRYFEILFNSAKVMQQAIIDAKMQLAPPDIFIAPEIRDIRALEFYRAEEVFTQAEPAMRELRQRLEAALAARQTA